MENKSYFERHVRRRCGKLRQAIQNVSVRESTREKTHTGRCQRTSQDNCNGNENTNECRGIRVTETYDEVLDLRDTYVIQGSSKGESQNYKQCFDNKNPESGQKRPNMHYKLLTMSSVKNSSKFSREFNTKTNIISARIVNKQLELESKKKPSQKSRLTHKTIPKLDQKLIVKKILEKQKELPPKSIKKCSRVTCRSEAKLSKTQIRTILHSNSNFNRSSTSVQMSRPRFQLSTNLDKGNRGEMMRSKTSSLQARPPVTATTFQTKRSGPNASENQSSNLEDRPRFKLSTRVEAKKSNPDRPKIPEPRTTSSLERYREFSTKATIGSTPSILVTMEKSSASIFTQTDFKETRNKPIQTCRERDTTKAKKMQTRLCKTYTTETSAILIEGPAKYTNTEYDYPCTEQPTQMYEHFTINDMVCLEWVNRHLFGVTVNPHNIVVDDRIKEVSELASKSSFFSEVKSFL